MSFSEIASDDGFQQAHMRFLTLSEPRHKRNQKKSTKNGDGDSNGKKNATTVALPFGVYAFPMKLFPKKYLVAGILLLPRGNFSGCIQ